MWLWTSKSIYIHYCIHDDCCRWMHVISSKLKQKSGASANAEHRLTNCAQYQPNLSYLSISRQLLWMDKMNQTTISHHIDWQRMSIFLAYKQRNKIADNHFYSNHIFYSSFHTKWPKNQTFQKTIILIAIAAVRFVIITPYSLLSSTCCWFWYNPPEKLW